MNTSTLLATSHQRPEAAVIASLALDHRDPQQTRWDQIPGTKTPVIISQSGIALASMEFLQSAPTRPSIHTQLTTKEDLLAYLKDQSGTENIVAIFARREKLTFSAFLSYHRPDTPSWLSHTATVAYQHSHQFQKWQKCNGQKMGQDDFATFLDENSLDIINPTGAEVVTFASHLEVTRTERFKSARNLANGEVAFTFTNESSGDSQVKFPTEMTLSIPIWIGGDRIALKAKLFYRVIEGELTFWYKIMNLEDTIDHLFEEDVTWFRLQINPLMQDGVQPASLENFRLYRGTPPATPAPLPLPSL